jgi:phosphoribosylanthranilate isomerase
MNSSFPKIKVCGMRDPDNIRRLVELQPDYIGFILFPGSKRYLGKNYRLTTEIPNSIKRVGIFVNALIPEIFEWVSRLELDFVQLHGIEPPEYCMEMNNLNIKVIKTFGIDADFDFSILKDYIPYCDYFLFDTKSILHGGSGEQFDWSILKNIKLDKPIFLSGGIGPDDVQLIRQLHQVNIHAVDINSRFETGPGLKDILLLDKFFKELRS